MNFRDGANLALLSVVECFETFWALEEWSFRLGLRVDLSRFGLVVQAALSDGFSFDPFTFEQDCLAAPEVDVGQGEIVEALVVSAMIVMLDESRDLRFEGHRKVNFSEAKA